MSLRLIAGPTVEPVTVAFLRDHAKLDDAESNTLLSMYLKAARRQAEHLMERSIMLQTWGRTLDAFPAAIELGRPSVQREAGDSVLIESVVSVTYYDAAGALTTLDPSAYVLDDRTEPGYVLPVTGWPTTEARANAVEVRWRAGLTDPDDVPTDIVHWICLRAATAVRQREDVGDGGLQPLIWAERMLDPHRRWVA